MRRHAAVRGPPGGGYPRRDHPPFIARLPASKGLLASAGVSARAVDSARMRAKPAMATGSTHASVPPASITSASPWRIILKASPMLWAPAVGAEAAAQ